MPLPVSLKSCRSHRSPAIRSSLCRSIPRPQRTGRDFAHSEFLRDRLKKNSKRCSSISKTQTQRTLTPGRGCAVSSYRFEFIAIAQPARYITRAAACHLIRCATFASSHPASKNRIPVFRAKRGSATSPALKKREIPGVLERGLVSKQLMRPSLLEVRCRHFSDIARCQPCVGANVHLV